MIETDALIVGAGPAGLYQAFQLGLLEARSHIVDALPFAGGQCVALYGDKPIYDIPGIKVCTGRELTANLLDQLTPFQPQFHLGQTVVSLARHDDGRWQAETAGGEQLLCKAIFIAAGVGAFQPRQLKLVGAQTLSAQQLLHAMPTAVEGKRLLVLGDTEAAISGAVFASDSAATVTLIHRKDAFDADDASLAAFRSKVALGTVRFLLGQPTALQAAADGSVLVQVLLNDGTQTEITVDCVVAALGLSPKLGPIADWGLALERKHLVVDPVSCVTSVPGIFAVGDIVAYPGKKKLIASGFHEAIMAAYAALPILHPGRKMLLEYTTTSTRLHGLLGLPTTP